MRQSMKRKMYDIAYAAGVTAIRDHTYTPQDAALDALLATRTRLIIGWTRDLAYEVATQAAEDAVSASEAVRS